jgi:formate-dependent nitrite reductase membrane component NrfD
VAADKSDVPYDAPWAQNLRHRPDPNRVSSFQMPVAGVPVPQRPASPARAVAAQSVSAEPSYYDVSPLKEPVWKWEIASYFFLGGLSAGAYLLGRAAERCGGECHPDLRRLASYVALGTILPCPPLLIHDLGDPKRFHHMLRIWKPSSPMNFGSWAIAAYGGMAAFEAGRQYLSDKELRSITPAKRGELLSLMNNGVVLALHDAMGVPFSLIVAGYTGVLLSCTSNPLWCKNPWLGPLFSASAISTGAEAISLALDLLGKRDTGNGESQEVLQLIDTAAHLAEFICMEGFKKCAGDKAKPALRGKYGKYHRLSLAGIAAAEVLKRLPVPERRRKPVRIAASALGLLAGFSLRWFMVHGGHSSAADPHAARLVSRPRRSLNRQPSQPRTIGAAAPKPR